MQLQLDADRSIYLQIAEQIEDQILQQGLREDEQVPSTNQLAALYRINPATAAKGIALLADEGILYKQRGIGMFVAAGARKQILAKRQRDFFARYVEPMLLEAEHLNIEPEEINAYILGRNKTGHA
ncbi:MAG: GntR family transcriptional regulator [Clostridiaceae bacterium]|nr:GntR family transcriptional regulator [Clostridiaceae bacterium]